MVIGPSGATPPEFVSSIQRALPAGELVRASIYGWRRVRQADHMCTVTLTTVSMRLVQFQRTQIKPGSRVLRGFAKLSDANTGGNLYDLVDRRSSAEIAHVQAMTSFPISRMNGISYQPVVAPVVHWQYGLLQFEHSGDAVCLGGWNRDMEWIYTELDAARSGLLQAQNVGSVAQALTRLSALLQEGLITADEFSRAKDGLVGRAGDIPESAASLIRQLHSLFLSGVLSEPEYRAKKFDLLAGDWSAKPPPAAAWPPPTRS